MKKILQIKGGSTKGYTFVEIMVTLALFFLLASIGLGAYFQYYSFSLINNDVSHVQSLIKNTRFKALKNPDGSSYGIHIDTANDELTSFKSSYTPGQSGNVTVTLEQLEITDLSLQPAPGTTNEVLFQALTAKTQNTGSFSIGDGDFTYSFTINAQGAIE